MLKGLFGNQNVERILLFLFVNERCYATQIQVLLGVPLTPLQKALARLERDGIVCSHYERKIRFYQFNPTYPLRFELQTLLKKAYTLLSTQEKKYYCYIHKPRTNLSEQGELEKSRRTELLTLWKRMAKTQQLSLSAKSWQGTEQLTKIGKAEVTLTAMTPSVLIFQENGYWFHDQLPETAFSNTFRWTLDLSASLITLEHLRHGATQPVFLFHLTSTGPGTLESVDAHLCAEDVYLGNMVWNAKGIDFHWRIIGPHKNSQMTYKYS